MVPITNVKTDISTGDAQWKKIRFANIPAGVPFYTPDKGFMIRIKTKPHIHKAVILATGETVVLNGYDMVETMNELHIKINNT